MAPRAIAGLSPLFIAVEVTVLLAVRSHLGSQLRPFTLVHADTEGLSDPEAEKRWPGPCSFWGVPGYGFEVSIGMLQRGVPSTYLQSISKPHLCSVIGEIDETLCSLHIISLCKRYGTTSFKFLESETCC